MKILLDFNTPDQQRQESQPDLSSISIHLHVAVSLHNTSEVRQLLQNHNFASSDLGSALIDVSRSGNIEIVNLLLDAGADVNWTGNDENSALMAACRSGKREVAMLLLENSARVEKVHLYGRVLKDVLDEVFLMRGDTRKSPESCHEARNK
ncbi:ankyrin repeat-containing domain protein [Cadophora sp. MPI-SDFR-AT-0126]|nr:ankyrin repeat-containing domain protein [Leotiomycetes sp. MPI-SDFR-AT-0126]